MKNLFTMGLIAGCLAVLVAGPLQAQEAAEAEKPGVFGIRLGIGTDIQGGIAYGGQVNYTLFKANNAFELGLGVFGGKFEETSDNGFNIYEEETTIFVIGAIGNYLFNWSMEKSGPYFVAGLGVGAVSVEWEERSPTDTSLGTPLPGGGSMQSEEGSGAGIIINFGIGHRFSENFDLRAQIPTFFFDAPGDASGVVPTITVTAGFNFM